MRLLVTKASIEASRLHSLFALHQSSTKDDAGSASMLRWRPATSCPMTPDHGTLCASASTSFGTGVVIRRFTPPASERSMTPLRTPFASPAA